MTANYFSLSGQDVWVFGGAGYLGGSTVECLQAMGASVLCVDLEDRAQRLVQERNLQEKVTPASLDVSDCAAAEVFIQEQLCQRGTPHGLVIMTYKSTGKSLADLTVENFDDVNHCLTATFALARTVGTCMAQARRGSIVLFSSMYGTVAPDPSVYHVPMNPNPIEYGVGKAGIQQMARYFATHWGRQNVRCNSIAPGPFPFPSLQKETPGFIERLGEKTCLGRIGQAKEIAGTVAFLLSGAASYITGHNLAVDGGWTAW